MANCPKCNAHLKLTDWKQHCPHCGANITVYDLQERLMQQADVAEVQYYHFQKKVDRLKASFVGSKLAITRIFTSLLPVGPLFLTLINGTIKAPLKEGTEKISALTIYEKFDDIGDILGLFNTPSVANKLFIIAFALLLLSLVATVLRFVFIALACSPKGKVRNYATDAIILILTIGSAAVYLATGNNAAVSGSLGIGAYLYILMQIVNVVIDVLTFKKGIDIKHAQCFVGGIPIEEYFEMQKSGMTVEEIRQEQYKRLQADFDAKEAKLKEEAEKAEKEAEQNVG